MFWNFGVNISALEQLLDKDPTPKLEDVLVEQDLLQELRNQNDKLINYLTNDENMKKIVSYVVNGGNSPYSRSCSEILSSNAGLIIHTIFEDISYVQSMWEVIHMSVPDPDALTNVMSIMTNLSIQKPGELFEFFIDNEIPFVEDVLSHMEDESTCELIVRMITTKLDDTCFAYHESFINADLVDRLVKIVTESLSAEASINSSTLLCELLRTIRTETFAEEVNDFERWFTDSLFSDPILDRLVNGAASLKDNQQVALACAEVLNSIFVLQRCGSRNGDEFYHPSNIPARYMRFSKHDYTNFCHNIEPLVNMLKIPNDTYCTILCEIPKPFGRFRLLILETLVALALYNDENMSNEFSRLNFPGFLMDLFEEFPENNIMHCQIELIFTCVLLGYRWKNPSGVLLYVDHSMLASILSNDACIKKILYLSTKSSNYAGHVREIQRSLSRSMKESYHKNFIIEKIESFPSGLKDSIYKSFDILAEIDETEAIDSRFLRTMSDDFDAPDNLNTDDTARELITIEKAIEFFRQEKASLVFEELTQEFEDQLQPNIDASLPPDPFSQVDIQIQSIPFNHEPLDSIRAAVEETISDIIKIDSSSPKSLGSPQVQINSIEGDGPDASPDQQRRLSCPDELLNESNLEAQPYTRGSKRCAATSSPIIVNDIITDDCPDAFDDELSDPEITTLP